jgi:hypothetical protein
MGFGKGCSAGQPDTAGWLAVNTWIRWCRVGFGTSVMAAEKWAWLPRSLSDDFYITPAGNDIGWCGVAASDPFVPDPGSAGDDCRTECGCEHHVIWCRTHIDGCRIGHRPAGGCWLTGWLGDSEPGWFRHQFISFSERFSQSVKSDATVRENIRDQADLIGIDRCRFPDAA